MNPEVEREISKIRKTVEENNKIIKGLQKKARYDTLFSILKWVFWVVLFVGAYLITKPFFDQFMATYESIQQSAQSVSEVQSQFNTEQIQEFLKQFGI